MEVTATGAGIRVPVGDQTLGRLFNVLGETIDNGDKIETMLRNGLSIATLRHLKIRVRW